MRQARGLELGARGLGKRSRRPRAHKESLRQESPRLAARACGRKEGGAVPPKPHACAQFTSDATLEPASAKINSTRRFC